MKGAEAYGFSVEGVRNDGPKWSVTVTRITDFRQRRGALYATRCMYRIGSESENLRALLRKECSLLCFAFVLPGVQGAEASPVPFLSTPGCSAANIGLAMSGKITGGRN